MSLCPPEGRPVVACPDCATDVGVVRVDVDEPTERELLVDLEPYALSLSAEDSARALFLWVEMFSGHPPVATVLPTGMLHRVHRCLTPA